MSYVCRTWNWLVEIEIATIRTDAEIFLFVPLNILKRLEEALTLVADSKFIQR